MFRSLSRVTVVAAFVLALLLSTVPAQALPRDLGSVLTPDASWLDMALGWLGGLFGGGEAEPLQSIEMGGKSGLTKDPGNVSTTGSSCIDPYGGCGG